jgi:hypothetical protein
MAINAQDVNWYRDYLEKEMTIMGVLSAFSIAVAGFVAKDFADAKFEISRPPWDHWQFVVLGCGLFITAAAAFYHERSLLAWYSGQLALKQVDATWPTQSLRDWLLEVDGWSAWIPYRVGFGALIVGGIYFAMAISQPAVTMFRIWLPVGAFVVLYACWMRLLYVYSLDEEPWTEFKSSKDRWHHFFRGK